MDCPKCVGKLQKTEIQAHETEGVQLASQFHRPALASTDQSPRSFQTSIGHPLGNRFDPVRGEEVLHSFVVS